MVQLPYSLVVSRILVKAVILYISSVKIEALPGCMVLLLYAGASFQIFFWVGGGQRRLGERSQPNQQGVCVGRGCKLPSRIFFDFELFYVLFEAT